MQPDPLFWEREFLIFWDSISPLLMSMVLKGGEAGAALLPESVSLLIDWDVFNEEAVEYLRKYRLGWLSDIAETTRNRATETIAEWIEAGGTKPELDKLLGGILPASRASNIATTEVTRIYAAGNQLSWKATGIVTAQKWQTAKDEKVCPLCAPLHNKIVGIDDVFTQSPTDVAEGAPMMELYQDPTERYQKASTLIRNSGAFVGGPPRHPNCRCWLLPVVSQEEVERQMQDILDEEDDMSVEQFLAELRADPRVVVEDK